MRTGPTAQKPNATVGITLTVPVGRDNRVKVACRRDEARRRGWCRERWGRPSFREARAVALREPTAPLTSPGRTLSTGLMRVNEQIRISPVRVINDQGVMLGVMPTGKALETAREMGMDLVEVAPNERPPVCKIMDFGKFKYSQKKKASKQKQHQVQVKEIRVARRPATTTSRSRSSVPEFLEHKDKGPGERPLPGAGTRSHRRRAPGYERSPPVLDHVAKVEKNPSMEADDRDRRSPCLTAGRTVRRRQRRPLGVRGRSTASFPGLFFHGGYFLPLAEGQFGVLINSVTRPRQPATATLASRPGRRGAD